MTYLYLRIFSQILLHTISANPSYQPSIHFKMALKLAWTNAPVGRMGPIEQADPIDRRDPNDPTGPPHAVAQATHRFLDVYDTCLRDVDECLGVPRDEWAPPLGYDVGETTFRGATNRTRLQDLLIPRTMDYRTKGRQEDLTG